MRSMFWKSVKQGLQLARSIDGKSMGMQRRLALYWVCMALATFAAVFLVLSLTGVFSHSNQKLSQTLHTQQSNTVAALSDQSNAMVAQGISLSQKASNAIVDLVYGGGVKKLNDQPDKLLGLERISSSFLISALESSPCNGAYLVVDASTNTAAPGAENSRAGLYLRYANLSTKGAAQQDIVMYRGIPDVARKNGMELHNRWDLEFDIADVPAFSRAMSQPTNRLVDGCFWSGQVRLTDTWEDILLLVVPIQDQNGVVQGICGLELSDLYFRLSYPARESQYGNLITVLAPMENGVLDLSHGMTGCLEGTYLSDADQLTVKEGKHFNTYKGESGTYFGLHTPLEMPLANGASLYAVTLVSKDTCDSVFFANRLLWSALSLVAMIGLFLLAIHLSRKFVQPISESIQLLMLNEPCELPPSGIQEIDDLMTFVQEKLRGPDAQELPPNVEELFHTFSEHVATLTSTERTILQYFIDGLTLEEVASTAYISINTVKKHNTNINKKLGVSSRDELMLYIDLFRRTGRLDEIGYHV